MSCEGVGSASVRGEGVMGVSWESEGEPSVRDVGPGLTEGWFEPPKRDRGCHSCVSILQCDGRDTVLLY